jgi:hypothetical protein
LCLCFFFVFLFFVFFVFFANRLKPSNQKQLFATRKAAKIELVRLECVCVFCCTRDLPLTIFANDTGRNRHGLSWSRSGRHTTPCCATLSSQRQRHKFSTSLYVAIKVQEPCIYLSGVRLVNKQPAQAKHNDGTTELLQESANRVTDLKEKRTAHFAAAAAAAAAAAEEPSAAAVLGDWGFCATFKPFILYSPKQRTKPGRPKNRVIATTVIMTTTRTNSCNTIDCLKIANMLLVGLCVACRKDERFQDLHSVEAENVQARVFELGPQRTKNV